MNNDQVAHIMALVDSHVDAIENGFSGAPERDAIKAALLAPQQAGPTEAQIDAYCEAWGAAFEAEEPEAFGVTVEPLSASLRRCIVAGLRAAISAPTAVEPDERAGQLLDAFKDAPFVQAQGCMSGCRPMTFGGCPFCGRQNCVAGECRASKGTP